ncbi:hypothetical protein RvY_03615 [Ramazzottius varieornatus]|uniref:Uncharacterized protein n=1 Tax=Ramazzottius varieornatus TaxID=947166 RepID=A0A1D1UNR0_RAMVA|nr:hypothetical protein RvY_03615 [Ramazzottius varieornatus]
MHWCPPSKHSASEWTSQTALADGWLTYLGSSGVLDVLRELLVSTAEPELVGRRRWSGDCRTEQLDGAKG